MMMHSARKFLLPKRMALLPVKRPISTWITAIQYCFVPNVPWMTLGVASATAAVAVQKPSALLKPLFSNTTTTTMYAPCKFQISENHMQQFVHTFNPTLRDVPGIGPVHEAKLGMGFSDLHHTFTTLKSKDMTSQEHCQAFYDWLKLRRVNAHRNGIVLAMFLWSQKWHSSTITNSTNYRADKDRISPFTLSKFLNKPNLLGIECYPNIGPKHAKKLGNMRPNELKTMYKAFGSNR